MQSVRLGVSAAGATDGAQDSDGEEEEAAVQGEQAGKDTYKRVQASSAAAVQRQKAARTQVALSSAYGLWAMGCAYGCGHIAMPMGKTALLTVGYTTCSMYLRSNLSFAV